jgi:hypothetical protein
MPREAWPRALLDSRFRGALAMAMIEADPFARQLGAGIQLAPGGHLMLAVANDSTFSMFTRT